MTWVRRDRLTPFPFIDGGYAMKCMGILLILFTAFPLLAAAGDGYQGSNGCPVALTLKKPESLVCKGQEVTIETGFVFTGEGNVQQQLEPAKICQTVYIQIIDDKTDKPVKEPFKVGIGDLQDMFGTDNYAETGGSVFSVTFSGLPDGTVKISQVCTTPPPPCQGCDHASEPIGSLLSRIRVSFTPKNAGRYRIVVEVKAEEPIWVCIPVSETSATCCSFAGKDFAVVESIAVGPIACAQISKDDVLCAYTPATFSATTIPPGFENLLVWTDSDPSKDYGEPIGYGPSCTKSWSLGGNKIVYAFIWGHPECPSSKSFKVLEIISLTATPPVINFNNPKDVVVNLKTNPPDLKNSKKIVWDLDGATAIAEFAGGKILQFKKPGVYKITAACDDSKAEAVVLVISVRILADTNRDGFVDNGDMPGKSTKVSYLGDTGALVLVNCDDDDGLTTTTQLHRDFDDSFIGSPPDLDDISPVLLYVEPPLPVGYRCVLKLSSPDSARVFCYALDLGLGTEILGPARGSSFDLTDVMSGTTVLSLGIEGLVFSENITLRAEITEGSNMFADDSVELLTTPLLLNPNTQAPINVFIGEFPPDFKPYTDAIARASIAAGCNAVQKKTSNYFIQDDCEFAFTRRICSNPLYEMTLPVVLVMTDINSDWYRDKLTGNYGIFKSPASDDGGNIECLPRKTDKDYGRVMLSDSAPKELIQFFEKQKVQAPVVILSTTRILLRHTDEVACVVNTNGGPAVIVPDVDLALKTIDKTPNNTTWPYEGFTTYGEVKDYYNADGKAFKVDIDASLKLNNTALAAYKLIHAPAILRWFRPGIRLSAFNNKDSCNSVPLNLNLLMPREKVNEFRASLANDVRFATVTLIDDDAVKRMRGEIHCSTNVERVPLNKHK